MWEGGGVKPKLHFFCGTFRFGWVFPTQEPGFLFRVLLPFFFPSMVFIVFVTFCVLVRNPLPYDRWLLDAFTHICSNQPGIKRYMDVKAHIVEFILLLTISLTLKTWYWKKNGGVRKEMCACRARSCISRSQTASMCNVSPKQLWCFFNTAAVHFLRHVDYPWFQLSVSTQHVCSVLCFERCLSNPQRDVVVNNMDINWGFLREKPLKNTHVISCTER